MRIAFIGDQIGKVHYNRYKIFCRFMPQHKFVFFTIQQRKKIKRRIHKYDIIYYASFTLYNRCPLRHNNIHGSVTSWKCIYSRKKSDLRSIKKFRKLSANNLALCNVLKKYRKDIVYIPNGVDSELFCPGDKVMPNKTKIGWVGNKDRKEKNYGSVLRKVCHRIKRKKIAVRMDIKTTLKSCPRRHLSSHVQMCEYYRKLSFYLVTSSYEGTPNPALEAAACGIPVISTKVGNMPELITEGINGFLVECKTKQIVSVIAKASKMDRDAYATMSNNIRQTIVENWNWQQAVKKFDKFFEQ